MNSKRQLTPRDSNGRISRLKPCPLGLEKVLEFINEVPQDIEIRDLKLFPQLEDEFLRFLKKTSGTEDPNDVSFRNGGPRSMNEWVDRLLELHRVISAAFSELSEHTRMQLWREALIPQIMSDESYGPHGRLSRKDEKRQTRLAEKLAQRFAKDPCDDSLAFLSEFAGKDPDHARFYFWAFYGLARKLSQLREYRTNLNKVMKIAALNPTERLSFAPVLYRIVISQEYSVDEQGRFVQLGNQFTSALEDEELDVTRIRSCGNCRKVFWAGRKDQTCCTPACNHIRHSRRTREKYREGYYQGS